MKKLFTYLSTSLITMLLTPMAVFAQIQGGDTAPTIAPLGAMSFDDVFSNIITWVSIIAGGIAVIYLIYGGISYITGGAGGAENAKKIIINAIIGVVVILLAYTIVNVISGIFTNIG